MPKPAQSDLFPPSAEDGIDEESKGPQRYGTEKDLQIGNELIHLHKDGGDIETDRKVKVECKEGDNDAHEVEMHKKDEQPQLP